MREGARRTDALDEWIAWFQTTARAAGFSGPAELGRATRTQQSASRWWNGDSLPDGDSISTLAKILDVPPDEILKRASAAREARRARMQPSQPQTGHDSNTDIEEAWKIIENAREALDRLLADRKRKKRQGR